MPTLVLMNKPAITLRVRIDRSQINAHIVRYACMCKICPHMRGVQGIGRMGPQNSDAPHAPEVSSKDVGGALSSPARRDGHPG
jgi:hypothetical protein